MFPLRVVSPHLDDAALSAAVTIEALVRGGCDVTILNCFTVSEYGPHAGRLSRSELCRIRADEDGEFVRRVGGSLRAIPLNHVDALLRGCEMRDVRRPRPLSSADLSESAKLVDSFAQYADGAVLLPLALGWHVDHRIAQEAGLRSRSGSTLVGFYEDLPYAAEIPRSCIGPAVHSASRRLNLPLVPLAAGRGVDLGRKRALVSVYKSQLADWQVDLVVNYGRKRGGERLWVTRELREELCRLSEAFEPAEGTGWVAGDIIACAAHRKWQRVRSAMRRMRKTMTPGRVAKHS